MTFPPAGRQLYPFPVFVKVINLAALGKPFPMFVHCPHSQQDMGVGIVSRRMGVMDGKVSNHIVQLLGCIERFAFWPELRALLPDGADERTPFRTTPFYFLSNWKSRPFYSYSASGISSLIFLIFSGKIYEV